jgi:hypothetical protein
VGVRGGVTPAAPLFQKQASGQIFKDDVNSFFPPPLIFAAQSSPKLYTRTLSFSIIKFSPPLTRIMHCPIVHFGSAVSGTRGPVNLSHFIQALFTPQPVTV